ncbi:hypothetical protein GGTG_12421 [Gaeumannomyces tritici R3-111a-1]|uniref:Uncharacterized protein n=1 Tax=Gaeumannomyces tritici (strain R3-111a-1) TaxID=644352 RepID=J3PFZ6_GAET3|nr:hypothetical protein GGTG_12421 [Gaeumannomyces tritici R3-111a-1]EJT70248.1 hypothetical protein GGTG_12421 [Gaeumannomyces tritici R3-111a-1]
MHCSRFVWKVLGTRLVQSEFLPRPRPNTSKFRGAPHVYRLGTCSTVHRHRVYRQKAVI